MPGRDARDTPASECDMLRTRSGIVGAGSSRRAALRRLMRPASVRLPGAGHPRGEDAVEQVDPPLHRAEEVGRRTNAHGGAVAGHPRARQPRRRARRSAPACDSHGEAPHGDPVECQPADRRHGCASQLGIDAALDDPEHGLIRAPAGRQRPLGPPMGALHRLGDGARSCSGVDELVEAIATSEPRSPWMSRSGVSLCVEPSRCDVNVTPSSSTRRSSASEKTWNPPESVRIGPSQTMNRCSPPSIAIRSASSRRLR